MLFADYRTRVLRDYQEKVAAVALSSRLAHPRPAKIRDECITVCDERYNRKDDQILRTFFGPYDDVAACRQAIEQCGINKFKPLVNFLKNPAIDTDVKNIDLLAWLIDFQPRPFEKAKYSDAPEVQDNNKNEPPGDNQDTKAPPGEPADHPDEERSDPGKPPFSGKPGSNSRRKVIIWGVAIAISLGTAIYIYWRSENKASSILLTGNEKCMYWAGDHYQQISCNQKLGDDTLVIALDSEKLDHFRKITRSDTITEKSIGTIWYIKIKGNYEYYTSGGYHPIDPRLRLRPLTAYIIRNHIHSDQ